MGGGRWGSALCDVVAHSYEDAATSDALCGGDGVLWA